MSSFWASLKEDLSLTDRLMLLCALILSVWGVFCIYSAAAGTAGRGFDYAFRQAAWLFVSVVVMLVVMIVGHNKLLEGAYPLFGLALLLLFLTLLAPKVKGAQSWLGFGGVRFQPSEFAKVAVILTMSKFMTRYPPLDFKTFMMCLGVIMIPVSLVLLQPDAGSALVFLVISFGMLWAAGTPFKYLGGLAGLGLSALPFLYFMLKDYQKKKKAGVDDHFHESDIGLTNTECWKG